MRKLSKLGKQRQIKKKPPAIYTIGHSTNSIEAFIALLAKHQITALVDVRSMPYSRYNPQFNREAMKASLGDHGIRYLFMGDALGARSDNAACYNNGTVVYSRLAEQPEFKEAIARIINGSQEYRIALVCAEKEPLDCHRTILVAEELKKQGAEIMHILHNGSLENHEATLRRLIRSHKTENDDLFISEEQRIEEAIRRQESKLAYSEQDTRRQ